MDPKVCNHCEAGNTLADRELRMQDLLNEMYALGRRLETWGRYKEFANYETIFFDVITETDELVPAGVGDGKIDELVRRITDDKVLTIEPHLALFDAYKSIDNTEMKHKFEFSSSDEAFDAAVNAIKAILIAEGYKETNGGYAK